MSIPEIGGQVATSAIDALKNSPGLLVLILLQAATLAMIYFSVQSNQMRMQERELRLIERCFSPISLGKV